MPERVEVQHLMLGRLSTLNVYVFQQLPRSQAFAFGLSPICCQAKEWQQVLRCSEREQKEQPTCAQRQVLRQQWVVGTVCKRQGGGPMCVDGLCI